MNETKRGNFSGSIGFVLAAAGSAVGLGNLWRFPYLAAQYGGGIFLLVYLVLVVTFGFTLLMMELAIGRKTGVSCIDAYKKLDKRFGFLGYLARDISWLSWLNYGQEFGIGSSGNGYFTLNLGAMIITFGLSIKITIASIIGVIISILIYRRL